MRAVTIALAALSLANPGIASSTDEHPSQPRAARWVDSSPSSIELGKATFGLCIGCHGDEATGRIGIGPRIASKSYLAAATDDFLMQTIKGGRIGTAMVPWGAILNDEQIRGLIAYLRSLQPVDQAALDESKLEGDATKGERIFRNICTGCHGRSGAGYQETANGTGIGRRAFLDSATDGFIRYIVGQGKSQTKMRGFGAGNVTAVANLSAQEIDDTIVYLRANAW
ncbi:MAG: c-type cytochrome [bacterium]